MAGLDAKRRWRRPMMTNAVRRKQLRVQLRVDVVTVPLDSSDLF
jgi:hypothetical protein